MRLDGEATVQRLHSLQKVKNKTQQLELGE